MEFYAECYLLSSIEDEDCPNFLIKQQLNISN